MGDGDEARKQSCKDSHPIPLAHPAYPGRCTACADMCLASAHSTNDGFGSPHSGNNGIGKWISHYRDTNFPYNACVALQMPSKLVLHFHVFPHINMGRMMENVHPIQLPMNFLWPELLARRIWSHGSRGISPYSLRIPKYESQVGLSKVGEINTQHVQNHQQIHQFQHISPMSRLQIEAPVCWKRLERPGKFFVAKRMKTIPIRFKGAVKVDISIWKWSKATPLPSTWVWINTY